jgi:PilZ domain
MNERRATPRQRVFKAGSIEFDGNGVDCTIRNMSPAGAALDVATPVGIPHEVTLNILTNKERQHCYIIWRKKSRIGVAFVQSLARGEVPNDIA